MSGLVRLTFGKHRGKKRPDERHNYILWMAKEHFAEILSDLREALVALETLCLGAPRVRPQAGRESQFFRYNITEEEI